MRCCKRESDQSGLTLDGKMTKFLVTDECQRLARWLRLCGHDTIIDSAKPLSELYRRAYNEGRTVITRNHLVKASPLFRVIHLESERLEEQLRQLIGVGVLSIDESAVFSRCDVCNVVVELIEKAQVKDRVPPYVFQTQEALHICPSCQRVYWAATHWQRTRQFLTRLREETSHA